MCLLPRLLDRMAATDGKTWFSQAVVDSADITERKGSASPGGADLGEEGSSTLEWLLLLS